ncbi:hypothetical protein D3C79_1098660 [compost metagenome]
MAKPKTGTMKKATGFANACSRIWSGELISSGFALAGLSGIISAATTPATVAWTPELSTKNHNTAAPMR